MIRLTGKVDKMLYKNGRISLFSFISEEFGELCIGASKQECILYYTFSFDNIYELMVDLSLERIIDDSSGEIKMKNCINIKEVRTLKGGD